MAHLLVSVGTDGIKDWVKTPDGQKHSLGSLSVLSLVSKLAKNRRVARVALNDFLKGTATLLSVDEDQLWTLLAPRRAVWGSVSDGPFMSHDQRHLFTAPGETQGTPKMTTLASILDEADKALAYINKNASESKPLDPRVFEHLASISGKLASGQSDNSHFYGMPAAPKPDKPEAGFANGSPSSSGLGDTNKAASDLTIDVYESNLKVAQVISQKTAATASAINRLAGKRGFNSVRALADVSRVADRVACICEKTALTEEWVSEDLGKLAATSDHLHGLFHSKG